MGEVVLGSKFYKGKHYLKLNYFKDGIDLGHL